MLEPIRPPEVPEDRAIISQVIVTRYLDEDGQDCIDVDGLDGTCTTETLGLLAFAQQIMFNDREF